MAQVLATIIQWIKMGKRPSSVIFQFTHFDHCQDLTFQEFKIVSALKDLGWSKYFEKVHLSMQNFSMYVNIFICRLFWDGVIEKGEGGIS